MIEKLRKKFIIISMCSMFVVLLIIVSIINIWNYVDINKHSEEILQILTDNNGIMPEMPKNNKLSYEGKPENKPHGNEKFKFMDKMSPETPFSTRFFTATLDKKGNTLTIDTGKVAAITTKEAQEYAQKAFSTKKNSGFIDMYKYMVSKNEGKTLVVFLDCRREIETYKNFLGNSILISLSGMLGVFVLLIFFSKRIIRPVAESYEKQKRFITDASHEIKTPLSIINASVEIIEIEHGENQWTDSIHHQISRLSQLTSNLVALARMDEGNRNMPMLDFSLSDAVLESAEPFVALAEASNKALNINIEKNLTLHGNESSIRQLVCILLDNAMKYSSEHSTVSILLKSQGKRTHFSVSNQCDNIPQGNLDVLFERFYRPDSSRNSSTGGHGIGLSIAKSIVIMHKGKIKAESHDGKSLVIDILL